MSKLVDLLRERQMQEGLTDAQMAARLHVAKPTWIRTRQGGLPIGLSLLSGIMQPEGYPELAVEVLEFLRAYSGWRNRRWKARPEGTDAVA